jgi:sialate O-acetylesterase
MCCGFFRKTLDHSLLACLAALGSASALTMSVPFGNHMVLQRNMKVPIYGKGAASEAVTVTFDGQTKTATTGADGTWKVLLDPMSAGGPFTLVAKGQSTVTFTDVMVGEVWQCAGQSNMDTRMNYTEYPSLVDSIKNANVPLMRYITMRQPGQTIQWQVITPSTVGALSATGYFFGKNLVEHLGGVTVGLVVTAVGGTTIAQWMDPATIAADPTLKADTLSGTMYQSFLAPVVGYAIAGTAWYQGEQDCSSALYGYYTSRLFAMTAAWRKLWGQGDFPFLICQLAHTHALQTAVGATSNYAEIRNSQRIVADSIAEAWLEVNIDLGSTTTLHYDQKPVVGQRLGMLARGGVYHEAGLSNWRSPEPVAAWRSGSTVRVLVTQTAGGLKSLNSAVPAGFAIAGSDNTWYWGSAAFHGDTIVVQTASVATPTQIRYAWADFPIDNVVGGTGLPMTPFRYTGLSTTTPTTSVLSAVPTAGWEVRGRRLVAHLPAASAEATLDLLSADGRLLSRSTAAGTGGVAQWDLGAGSGVRLFRIESEGRTTASGKVALP